MLPYVCLVGYSIRLLSSLFNPRDMIMPTRGPKKTCLSPYIYTAEWTFEFTLFAMRRMEIMQITRVWNLTILSRISGATTFTILHRVKSRGNVITEFYNSRWESLITRRTRFRAHRGNSISEKINHRSCLKIMETQDRQFDRLFFDRNQWKLLFRTDTELNVGSNMAAVAIIARNSRITVV